MGNHNEKEISKNLENALDVIKESRKDLIAYPRNIEEYIGSVLPKNVSKNIEKQLIELTKTYGEGVRVHHEVQRNGRIHRVSSDNIVFVDVHGNKIGTLK